MLSVEMKFAPTVALVTFTLILLSTDTGVHADDDMRDRLRARRKRQTDNDGCISEGNVDMAAEDVDMLEERRDAL